MLDAIDAVAQGTGRTLRDLGDDRLGVGAVGVDPGVGAEAEDRRETLSAPGRMRADAAVVVDGHGGADIGFAFVRHPVRRLLVREPDLVVCSVAERLV